MDFRYGEQQKAAQQAAAAVFGAGSPDVWSLMAESGLLGLALPEQHSGAGCDVLEVCAVLVEQGRRLIPAPTIETVLVAGPAIASFGTDRQRRLLPAVAAGELVVVPAIGDPLPTAAADGTLCGTGILVPYGGSAQLLLVGARTPGGIGVYLVDPADPGVRRTEQSTSSRRPALVLELRDVPGEPLGAGCHRFLVDRSTLGVCAQQVGVLEEALRLTAEYTSAREQFGRPIATFQAVTMRAADAYADVETCRATMWRAAYLLSVGEPADSALAVAKFWAAEAGYRVSATAQHLHGGIGVSTDYPLHRYTLWARENELACGASGAQLAILGGQLAAGGVDS